MAESRLISVPNLQPPCSYDGTPRRSVLGAGTVLTRVHQDRFAATAWNPKPADTHWGGGRFDATTDDPYGFLYAGSDDTCAVAEALLRDLPVTDSGSRLLLRKALADRRISWIAPTVDLQLVVLRDGKELAAVGQDSWLTKSEPRDYAFTRRWGHRIRAWAPWSQGFIWRSRLEEASLAYVFFADRCPAGAFGEILQPGLEPPNHNRLDYEPGKSYILKLLAEYNVTVYR